MDKQVVIMNFSGVYDVEPFARNPRFAHLDCTHFSGTDGYCDSEGAQNIRSLIAPFSASGVHFIDSGNYHYVSRFWTEKIQQPFSLALFDHHTDMQPPLFQGLLSCGGWVKDLIDSHPWLRHVVLLGIPEEKLDSIPEICSRIQSKENMLSGTCTNYSATSKFISVFNQNINRR